MPRVYRQQYTKTAPPNAPRKRVGGAEVDRRMLATERRDLMVRVDWWCDTAEPFEWRIETPVRHESAERKYLEKFRAYSWR